MSAAAMVRRIENRCRRMGGLLAVLLLASVLLAPQTAAGQTYEAGLAAFNRAQYDAAEAAWLPLAESGDLRSQYALAVLYEKRAGRDPALIGQAAEWYRRAAEQGHPGAQTNYASLLARGRGVAEDQKLAVYYWQLAARQGNVLAQYNLGLAYYRGEGVVPDAQRALAWFRRAADEGMADAQFAMGQMNALGVGAARNSGRALTWFALAEGQGHVDAGRQAERLRAEGVAPEQPGAPLPLPNDGEAVAQTPATDSEDAVQPEPSASTESSETAGAPVPAAAPVQEAALPAPGAPGGAALWLGSFGSQLAAQEFRDKTLALFSERFEGTPLRIEAVADDRFRVFVAGLPDRQGALAFCRDLRSDIETAFCAVLEP